MSQTWISGSLFQRILSTSGGLRHRARRVTRTWTRPAVSSRCPWRLNPCTRSSRAPASWMSCWWWSHSGTCQSGSGMSASVYVCGCRTLSRGIGWMRFASVNPCCGSSRKSGPTSGTPEWAPKLLFSGCPTWSRVRRVTPRPPCFQLLVLLIGLSTR